MSFYRREDCVPCSNDPVCNCASDERCILTSRTCSQCPTIQCIKNQSSSGGGGINPGAIAGPVVAVLVIASLALFWWMRRKKRRDLERLEDLAKRARKAEATSLQLSHPGSPQPSSAHSASLRSYNASQLPQPPPSASRRSARSPLPPAPVNAEYYDENGTTIRVYNGNGTINADPNHRDDVPSSRNPFSDRQSISTMGTSSTQSTNIIPIQYIPPSRSEDGLSHAAKTLDEARQNLLKPRGAPQRPARSPELDLRLNPPAQQGGDGSRSRVRESFLSENSAAPSFLSGNSYDVYNDAPKIVTSKQVHVGRYQQAEVVQLGRDGSNPLNYHNLTIPTTAATSNQIRSPSPTMTFGSRALTPNSPASVHGRGYEREMEEGLRADEPPSAGASSGDLRFSMGSLGYRDSMSTVGTSRYLARPDGSYSQDHSNSSASSVSRVPPPRSASNQTFSHLGPEGRESMFSTKSNADSFLSGFPMIPPGQQGGPPPLPTNALPQSTSAMTLNNAPLARPSAPPVSFRHPQAAGAQPPSRPITQASVADSLLGSFPFVPPNLDDLAELPSANFPTGATPDTAKR